MPLVPLLSLPLLPTADACQVAAGPRHESLFSERVGRGCALPWRPSLAPFPGALPWRPSLASYAPEQEVVAVRAVRVRARVRFGLGPVRRDLVEQLVPNQRAQTLLAPPQPL